MAGNENNVLQVVNMRTFFSREVFMHSLGDIRFSKPIALKQAMYTVAFFGLYTLPIILIFGFQFSVYFVAIAFAPPIALGKFANQPIWGGRTLIGFIRVTIDYIGEPRGWTDHRNDSSLGKDVYKVDHNIWVSRRRELKILAALRDEKELGIKPENRVYPNDADISSLQKSVKGTDFICKEVG